MNAGPVLTVDHIIPRAKGGKTVEENLWLACRWCNEHKHDRTHARDPITQRRVRLFNPRKQVWPEHFRWSEDGTQVMGLTPCGRVTVEALNMNNPEIVAARCFWTQAGRHPR
ncbi:HNH endonuclease [Candidatus Poribacteria bacterium]|nr:HNH endonuclease [Candidatus Poribacteria bacterium]